MHYPVGHGYERRKDGYFDQLTAEECRTKFRRGFAEKYYEKIGGRRNEALDIRVYFLAAVDILNPVLKVIKKDLLKKAMASNPQKVVIPDDPETPADPSSNPPTQPKPAQPRKRFSFRRRM